VLIGLFAGLSVGCTTELHPTPTETVLEPTTAQTNTNTEGSIVGQAPPATQGNTSVVMLQPHATIDMPLPSEPVEMDQFGRNFIPRLIVVRESQAVLFKNSENDLHTVHVQDDDGKSLFNVAMSIQGGQHTHTFDKAGDYAVSCNVHQEMHATILVVNTPYAVVAERDGTFALSGVLPGTYNLILRRGPQRHEQVVEIVVGPNELSIGFPSTG
jgi:plastocyanin